MRTVSLRPSLNEELNDELSRPSPLRPLSVDTWINVPAVTQTPLQLNQSIILFNKYSNQ